MTVIESRDVESYTDTDIYQVKYLNNIIEQCHHTIKRQVRPTLRFKSFRSATAILSGIALIPMIRKCQLQTTGKLCPRTSSIP